MTLKAIVKEGESTGFLDKEAVDCLFKGNVVEVVVAECFGGNLKTLRETIYPNAILFINSYNGANQVVVRVISTDIEQDTIVVKAIDRSVSFQKVKGKDNAQAAFLEMLADDNVKIVAATGPAGSGKTFCSVAYALDTIVMKAPKGQERKVVFTKPTVTVGGAAFFGAVPGDVDDKFRIFLESYENTMEKVAGKFNLIQTAIDDDRLSFKPIQFTRGCNWDNTTLVVDECQNLQWHELKTVLTRLGEGSKAILLGDLKQKDTGKADGLQRFINSESFRGSSMTAHISFINDYRGPISKLVNMIAEEIENE